MDLQDLIRLREVCKYILKTKTQSLPTEGLPLTMSPEFFKQYYTSLRIEHNITKDSDLEAILEQCLKDIEVTKNNKTEK